jgi:hypothetical protein
MSDIDWTTELRKVEREFSGLPPEPSPVIAKARREAERREQERKEARTAAFGTWVRLVLVVALAGGLYLWPYARACGAGLAAYMGAETFIVVGGAWLGALTWRYRMARAHLLALAIVLWGLALIAVQVLPRVGYARVDPAHPQRWSCAVTAGR